MLTFTEEILLLLGDEEGAFLPIRKHAFECALAGAVLMDLAFEYRIDTDLQALVVTDATPTGNPMLDQPTVTRRFARCGRSARCAVAGIRRSASYGTPSAVSLMSVKVSAGASSVRRTIA